MSTKGDWPRPSQITREEKELRLTYMYTDMALEEFNVKYEELKQKGLIKRSGRILK